VALAWGAWWLAGRWVTRKLPPTSLAVD